MPERIPSHFEDEEPRGEPRKSPEKPGPRLVPTPSKDGRGLNPKEILGPSETTDTRFLVPEDMRGMFKKWQEEAKKETKKRIAGNIEKK